MNQLVIIGGGPGNGDYILPAAARAMAAADFVFADQRFISQIPNPNKDVYGSILKMPDRVREKLNEGSVAVVVSGDPLFYSLTKLLKAHFPGEQIRIIPGIGSLGYFAAVCQKTVEKAVYFSVHGRELDIKPILKAALAGRDVYLLCDREHSPDWLARTLIQNGMADMPVAGGSRLSYPDEQIVKGTAKELSHMDFDPLSVAAVFGSDFCARRDEKKAVSSGIRPGALWDPGEKALLKDGDFIRDKTPMTREEVRWIILGKLELAPGDVVWDIGAGTGSVSAECARFLKDKGGQVYSVEKNPGAVDLLKKNREKFHLHNMHILEGDAMAQIPVLPMPEKVFIGGSGRQLSDILSYISSLGPGIKVVTACVTVETLGEAVKAYKDLEFEEMEMTQIQISKAKPLGSYHIMEGNHPITLCMGRTGQNAGNIQKNY